MAAGLLGYAMVLTVAMFGFGVWVHETAERLVWASLLDTEMAYLRTLELSDPQATLPATETLRMWRWAVADALPPGLPAELAALPAGLHDHVRHSGSEHVVLVRDEGGVRAVLSLDIVALEHGERRAAALLLALVLVAVLALSLLGWVLSGRLIGPVQALAREVDELQPAQLGQRLSASPAASTELARITGALNDYLQRHDGFVERERAFVDSVSHELRTPIAVIGGAAEVLAQRLGGDPGARLPLQRIRQGAQGMEQLIGLLLVLAKEPGRLRDSAERFDLEALLPEVVEDHQHLTADKHLVLALGDLPASPMLAPVAIVHVAIGNLVRNAIENSDHGTIGVEVGPAGVVHVRDPGTGLGAEEIGRLYAQRARRGDGPGTGLGLALIGRICDHMGWSLRFDPVDGGGTHAELDLRASLVGPGPR
jgi:signal transduction histidine kinase